jgi:hypothetical protein
MKKDTIYIDIVDTGVKRKNKVETVDEFLARGGKITRVPTAAPSYKSELTKSTKTGGPATIVSMGEADLYHGVSKKSKVKKRAAHAIDISALPEELRKKYIDTVVAAKEQEDDEDA